MVLHPVIWPESLIAEAELSCQSELASPAGYDASTTCPLALMPLAVLPEPPRVPRSTRVCGTAGRADAMSQNMTATAPRPGRANDRSAGLIGRGTAVWHSLIGATIQVSGIADWSIHESGNGLDRQMDTAIRRRPPF